MIQTPLSIALTLWDMGIVADRNLIAWAESQILEQDRPADDLLEVAAQGAAACLKQGSISTALLSLSYSDQFCIRTYVLDRNSCPTVNLLPFHFWSEFQIWCC